jgi:hypothetical protein
MNIPENFNKIDGMELNIGTETFHIEVDNNEPGDCWVMHDGSKYPLCFDIDWENERYALIKCQPGDGRNGTSIATNAALTKYLMKNADSFVNSFIKDIVNILLNSKLI